MATSPEPVPAVALEDERAFPWRVHYQGPWKRGTFLLNASSSAVAETLAAGAVRSDERVFYVELVELP